ncbi:MAG TPA: LCP family protein [Candidatus Limnocylindrales bacterium]
MTDDSLSPPVPAGEPVAEPPAESAQLSDRRPINASPRQRYVAGLLSSLVPGLGHLLIGRPRAAALLLAPVVVAVALIFVVVLTEPRTKLLAYFADPDVIAALLVAQIAFLGWRLLAVATVVVSRAFPRMRARDALPVALLLIFVIVPQAALGAYTSLVRQEEARIFSPSVTAPFPIFEEPDAPGASVSPSGGASASPSPAITQRRTTIMLLGMDSGPDRNTASTDTMIVASLDPVAESVSMVSVPRDMVDVPLPHGLGVFHPKLNSLVSYVHWHPAAFPGYNGNGQAVLAGALGKMLGVRIDYYAQVNLPGFVELVRSVGGIDVNVDHALCDYRYREYGYDGFSIGAGRHHLNGYAALAYARIRHSAGESDFTRAARQQEVLVAIRDRIVRGGFLDDPVGFMRALGDTLETNVPPKILPDLAPLATDINWKDVYKTVIKAPLVRPGYDARGSIQLPDLAAIRALGARLFTAAGTMPSRTFVTDPPTRVAAGPPQAAPRCSAPPPAPTPTPKPTPKPSRTPSPSPSLSATPKSTASPSPS